MPRCSVIIVTYNSAAAIENCLRALALQDCEVVVVDNASQDDTVTRVRSVARELELQLIAVSRNIGFAGGVNQGVRAASGDVLLLLNPDAVVEAGAIDALLECFQTTKASAVGGALIAANGQLDKGFAFRRLPTLASLVCEALLINQLWPRNPVNRQYRCLDEDYSREQQVEQPAGAGLAVRRETWHSLQGMDPGFYPVWFEDVDFCARVLASGGTIFYCPDVRFHHSGAHSVGQLNFSDKQVFWYGNMVRYAAKHLPASSAVLLRLSIFVGMAVRIVAALLGFAPAGTTVHEALRGYARVGLWALGLDTRNPGANAR
jgi:N-acetylglucosaminyl-diphospho-decaprenol L-rhamnosyltransferase